MELTSESIQISKEDIVAYWLELFPELKTEEELRKLLHTVNDLSFDNAVESIVWNFQTEEEA